MKIAHYSSAVAGRCNECRGDEYGYVFEIELSTVTVRLCRKCITSLYLKIIHAANITANDYTPSKTRR